MLKPGFSAIEFLQGMFNFQHKLHKKKSILVEQKVKISTLNSSLWEMKKRL